MSNFFISYSHDGKESSRLAQWLHDQLARQGHDAFIYKKDIAAGQRWSERIDDLLPKPDLFILLLSEQSSRSDFIIEEVNRAYSLNCRRKRPIIVTVRVKFDGDPGYRLSAMLNPYQWLNWDSAKSSRPIPKQILRAAEDPNARIENNPASRPKPALKRASPLAPPFPMASPVPGGALALTNPFYIKRAVEKQVLELAAEPGATVTIEAPRQIGKSSLLQRYLTACLKQRQRTALVDLSLFDADDFQHFHRFLGAIAETITRELGLEQAAPAEIGGARKFSYWLEDHTLKIVREPVVLAFDEADSVFPYYYSRDFFKMLRSLQNSRMKSDLWQWLGLALVISTERNLLIETTTSPFNIGLHAPLQPFDLRECLRLARRFKILTGEAPGDAEVRQLWELLGGQPYLTHLAMHALVTKRFGNTQKLIEKADDEGSPFFDHLRALSGRISQHYLDLMFSFRHPEATGGGHLWFANQIVAFSPDGKRVVTAGLDRTARLWSAETGEALAQPMRHEHWARAVAFSPDGRRTFAFTQWWVHVAELDGDTWRPVISRLLPGAWRSNAQCHFLDEAGARIRMGVGVTGDSTQIVTLDFDHPGAEPIKGEPRALLEEWQRRLGLKINVAGEIVPLWQ